MNHVVFYSGGIASWATAVRVAERHGTADLTLLFTDTMTEDEDLYRFLDETEKDLGVPVTRLADGRTIWEVFRDEKFLGNTRADPCSKILKRNLSRKYIEAHFAPADTILYLGMDWTEVHRLERSRLAWDPYRVEGPMTEKPYLTREEMAAELARRGIRQPRLYDMGMSHNNCGGGCIKAGQGHFIQLLQVFPERYAEWEGHEEELRQQLGDVAILRDRSGGQSTPLPLRVLRERAQAGGVQMGLDDIAGCACFEAPETD